MTDGAGDEPVRVRLAEALRVAIRERDRVAVAALRSALAALANAEAVPVETMPAAGAAELAAVGSGAADAPRRDLGEALERQLVAVEAEERESAATRLDEHGQHEQAARLRAEAEVLRGHLR
jgi:uncharacterized protein YqeY